MLIFDKLFALLKKLGMTIRELAEQAGISEATLRRMRLNSLRLKNDPYYPSSASLTQICRVLHCRFSDILDYVPLP